MVRGLSIVLLFVFLSPAAAARDVPDPGSAGLLLDPPEELEAVYDNVTGNVSLSWTAPAQPGEYLYFVYRNGEVVGYTTDTAFEEGLGNWQTVWSTYTVTAYQNGIESAPSEPASAWKPPGGGGSCEPIRAGVIESFPYVTVGIREECLPIQVKVIAE